MSDYENAFCPKCGADLGRYRLDTENVQNVSTYCPHCHKNLVVTHGKDRLTVRVKS